MNTRSFFKSLARTAAIIALAPQLCFRVRPELPKIMPHERKVLKSSGLLVSVIYTTRCGGTIGLCKQTPEEHDRWRTEWSDELGLKYRFLAYHIGPDDGDVIVLKAADIPKEERIRFWNA